MYHLKTENKIELLFKGETPCICPFRNPVLMPSNGIQGGFSLNESLCSDKCPLFVIKEDRSCVELNCGTVTHQIKLNEPVKTDAAILRTL